jgi:hypothetical protein
MKRIYVYMAMANSGMRSKTAWNDNHFANCCRPAAGFGKKIGLLVKAEKMLETFRIMPQK